MTIFRCIPLVLLLLLAVPSEAQAVDAPQSSNKDEDLKDVKLLEEGAKLLKVGRTAEAIGSYFDKVIASFEVKYSKSDKTIFCARTAEETLFYLALAASDHKDAAVFSSTWADAYYLKAYGLIDLQRVAEARDFLGRALALSPQNAQYMAELAHVYGYEKNWSRALELYKAAAEAAEITSPAEVRTAELARAWRGMGYVYVELGRLDEAEAMYEKCLEADPNDRTASSELQYVNSLRAKQNKE